MAPLVWHRLFTIFQVPPSYFKVYPESLVPRSMFQLKVHQGDQQEDQVWLLFLVYLQL